MNIKLLFTTQINPYRPFIENLLFSLDPIFYSNHTLVVINLRYLFTNIALCYLFIVHFFSILFAISYTLGA